LRTNKTISIYSKGRDYKGDLSKSLIGQYKVYLEEHSTRRTYDVTGSEGSAPSAIANTSKGFFILEENVDLTEKMIEYDEKSYSIDNWDRYWNKDGTFHHIEAEFK